MSNFTLQLDEVIDFGYDIGLKDYPIFEEAHRPVLNRRITDHYKFREIGQETPEMFIFSLNRKMREIMPIYNELYRTVGLKFDVLSSSDYTETVTGAADTSTSDTTTGDTTSVSDVDANSRTVNSDTPQVMLSGRGDYASSAADATSKTKNVTTNSSKSDSAGTVRGTSDQTRTFKGRTGTAPGLIMEYRQSLLNVDMLIVAELEPCFMLLWSNGDGFAPHHGFPGGLSYGLPWLA